MHLSLRSRFVTAERRGQVSVKLRLRELRKSRKLTQAMVADGVNCSVAAYSRYENGSRQPSLDMVMKLADFFGVSLDYLFGRTPPDSSALSTCEADMLTKFRNAAGSVQEDVVDFLDLKTSKKEVLRK